MTTGYRLYKEPGEDMQWIETLERQASIHRMIYHDPPQGDMACLCTGADAAEIRHEDHAPESTARRQR